MGKGAVAKTRSSVSGRLFLMGHVLGDLLVVHALDSILARSVSGGSRHGVVVVGDIFCGMSLPNRDCEVARTRCEDGTCAVITRSLHERGVRTGLAQ